MLEVINEFGSFDRYIWSFTDGKVIRYEENADGVVLTRSQLSDAVAKDMKRRGFKFVGTVIIYSYLQGIGVIRSSFARLLPKGQECPPQGLSVVDFLDK